MPAKNRAQQKALYAKKGSKWVHEHHFDVIEGQPTKKKTAAKKRGKKK